MLEKMVIVLVYFTVWLMIIFMLISTGFYILGIEDRVPKEKKEAILMWYLFSFIGFLVGILIGKIEEIPSVQYLEKIGMLIAGMCGAVALWMSRSSK